MGTLAVTTSGDVQHPGVYEVALGITAAELFAECGGGMLPGQELYAVSPGGASSGFLPAALADTPLEFRALAEAGSMLGSGAVVAIGSGRCILDLALNLVRFFKNESCGKCVPCRIGTDFLHKVILRILDGKGRAEDIDLMKGICVNLGGERMMDSRSFCPLGDAAAWPIIWGGLKYFEEEFDYHIRNRRCMVGENGHQHVS